MHLCLPAVGASLPSLLTGARGASRSQAALPPQLRIRGAAQPSGSRRLWLSSAAELQLPAGFASHLLPLSARLAGRGQVAAGQGPMGAGSRGEGGGEEEGGGIWAPAPFIAAARRAGVPSSRSHGGANSCYQQAPGRLQHCGRRHHPVASDCRGGNAGERRGRRPPRPKPGRGPGRGCGGARAQASLCGLWDAGAACDPGVSWVVPRLPAPGCLAPGLGLGAWPGGEGRSRRGGPGGSQGRGGEGTGRRAELESSETGRGFPRGPLLPRALGGRAVHAGRTGSRGAGWPVLGWFLVCGASCFPPRFAEGLRNQFWNRARAGLTRPLLCST